MGSQVTMHSAEWYRGAVAALEDCEYSRFEVTMNQVADYRRLLAGAEAREAGGTGLAEQLEAAKAEAKERTTMAARAQEAMRYLLNGLPATDAIWAAYGNADSARAWLASRDDRMKALGAAEWVADLAGDADGDIRITHVWMRDQAAALRQKAGE